jgi:hypothetical protein
MADTNTRITGLPDSGSPQRVAFDLMVRIYNNEGGPLDRRDTLDLYAQCLDAATGRRTPPKI